MTQALKFETFNMHLDKFDITLNQKKNEIISAGDDLVVKFFDINTKSMKDCIDVSDEIKAISFGCGKLVYGQLSNLQMVDLDSNTNFSEEAAILLTKFNSNIRKIYFNEKLNLVISFSEDDDLHVVNLFSLDVLKYKSNHEGSLKNMAISPNGDFLLTTGCDGYLSIYEFLKNEDIGKIIPRKKISISQKLSLENIQSLDVDINSFNHCVIGGNIILRTLTLDNSFSYDSISIYHENSISHNDEINYVRWFNNLFLVTCDVKNLFKIWNFSAKHCVYQLEIGSISSPMNDNYVTRIEIFKTASDNFFNLIFIDKNGKLNISDKINCSIKSIDEANSHKYKDVKYKLKANEDIEVDRKIEHMIGDLEADDSLKKKLGNILEDFDKNDKRGDLDLLNLSDVEDENGEIKDAEEIQKAKEERQRKNVVESFADDIIGCLPQQILISTSTNFTENSNSRYLCWNMIGQVIQRQEVTFKAIDIVFADLSNKKKITYIDSNDISLAVMNNCGAFLSNKLDDENEDAYEKEDVKQCAVVEFKSIQTNLYSAYKDWSVTLPSKESPLCLAMGTDWCAVFTNSFYLRVFSLYGNQKMILSLPQIVTMAGYENYLAYVYHSSVPLFSCQNLRIKILDSNQLFNEVFDGILPLSPESTLTWFTYSEDGILVTCDSRKIIRGFLHGVCHNWIPLLDLESVYSTVSNTNFWPIGILDEEIYGVELKSYMNEPPVNSKLPIKVLPLKIPFIETSVKENKDKSNTGSKEEKVFSEDSFLTRNLFLRYDQSRFNNYKLIKLFRDVKSPEFYYTDNLKDEDDLLNKKRENDKIILSHMRDCIVNGTANKVIDLFNYVMLDKTKELAIKLCNQLDQNNIEQLLIKKLGYANELKSRNKEKYFINSDLQNGVHSREEKGFNFIKDNNIRKNNQEDDDTNKFASFAINVDNFRNVEEEVRNQLANEEKSNLQEDDYNTFSLKQTLNLEKKNVKYFILIFRVIHSSKVWMPILNKILIYSMIFRNHILE